MRLSFQDFVKYMKVILDYREKKKKIEDFFEEHITTEHFFFNYADKFEDALVDILAKYFNCFYTMQGVEDNDIYYWLSHDDGEKIVIGIDDEDVDITTLKDFYKYLMVNKGIKSALKEDEISDN